MRIASIYRESCFLVVAIVVANALLCQPPANKPNTQNQPSSAATVNATPSGYVVGGQNPKVNYVRTRRAIGRIATEATFDTSSYREVKEITTYTDGLGRPLQTVTKQATFGSTPKDFVAPVVYDQFGREKFKYLPYSSDSSNGKFKLNPFSNQSSFYQNTTLNPGFTGEQVYYSQTNFEASPLNRTLKNLAPGNSWAGNDRGTQQKYLSNTIADSVRIWSITSNALTYSSADTATNIPSSSGYYSAGQLYKNVDIDEAGNAEVEYKDKEGQVILKKVQIDSIATDYSGYSGFLCTYYIYDDLNRLRFIIQPKAVGAITATWTLTTPIINELSFRYEYDSLQRIIAKKIPGSEWTSMVYDMRDRLVFTQDGNLHGNNQWLTTLYDVLNRPILTGLISFSYNRDSLQNFVNGTSKVSSNIITSGSTSPSVTADLSFPVREAGRVSYQATNSITLENGFESENSANFMAEIVSIGNTNFNDTLSIYNSPLPSGNNLITLTESYYDNYSWTSKSYNTANNSKLDAGTNLHAETLPATASNITRGLLIGTKVRVLDNPANLASGPFLTTVSFYDEQARPIQTNRDNYLGGMDIVTIRYDFTGKNICSYAVHNNAAGNENNLRIKTNIEYDQSGLLTDIWKTINDDSTRKILIDSNSYNLLGQLQKKQLGRSKDSSGNYTSSPLETLDYEYNVHGWLTSINKNFANNSGTNANNRWFGMQLNYDWGFGTNQYNGTIAGTKWRSKGDGAKKAYGFGYDKTNRLLSADFSQHDGSNYVDNATINFDMQVGDGVKATSAYDQNGNINRMQQWGLKLTGSSLIDSLYYTYQISSNKLAKVTDGKSDSTTILGDFKDGKNGSSDDYNYDINGNLTLDNNKAINSITYNHLNLPWTISVTGKGKITYTYDATGNKLRKQTIDSTASPVKTTTTDYVSGAIYENNALRFINHEEGRIRKKDSTTFVFDYFINDHLGNVRALLTEEQQTDAYPVASLETNSLSNEKIYYSSLDTGRISKDSATGYPIDTYTNPNNYIQKLNGSGAKVGAGIVLKVMVGDKFNIRANSWYRLNNQSINSPTDPFNDLLNALSTGVAGVSSGKATNSQLIVSAQFNNSITDILGDQPYASGRPKAYLNWVFFDEQFKYDSASSGFDQVGVDTVLKTHTKTDLLAGKSGYLYVYVSNVTPNINVFFDNLQVTHIRGPLLEETHYYPFGLTMTGISSSALLFGGLNQMKFNNVELSKKDFNDGSGLEWYDTEFRRYNQQIGRFTGIDELSENNLNISPYAFAQNNPIVFSDPFGLDTTNGKTPKKDPSSGDVWINDKGIVSIYDPGQGWTEQRQMGEVIVGKQTLKEYEAYQEMMFPLTPEGKIWYTIVQKPTFWERLKDLFYQGKNIFGVKIYRPHYGGTIAPIGLSGIGIIGKIRAIGNLFRSGFSLEGQLAEIWSNRRLFINWLKNNHSLTRVINPLSADEAQLVIDNAKRLGIELEHNLNGLKGLETSADWGKVPHFKVGNIHIPIQSGLENILIF
jgi:RHS repeat-associated protein